MVHGFGKVLDHTGRGNRLGQRGLQAPSACVLLEGLDRLVRHDGFWAALEGRVNPLVPTAQVEHLGVREDVLDEVRCEGLAGALLNSLHEGRALFMRGDVAHGRRRRRAR